MGHETVISGGLCLLTLFSLSQCFMLRRTIGWPEDPCGQTLNRVRHLPSMPNSPENPPNRTVPGNQFYPGHVYGRNSLAYMLMLESYDAPDIPDPSPLMNPVYRGNVAPGVPGSPMLPGAPGSHMAPGVPGSHMVPGAPGSHMAPGVPMGLSPMMECRCESGCELNGGLVMNKYAHQCVTGFSCCCMAK